MSHKNYRNHGCVETMIRCVGKKDLVGDTGREIVNGRSPIKLFLKTHCFHARVSLLKNEIYFVSKVTRTNQDHEENTFCEAKPFDDKCKHGIRVRLLIRTRRSQDSSSQWQIYPFQPFLSVPSTVHRPPTPPKPMLRCGRLNMTGSVVWIQISIN